MVNGTVNVDLYSAILTKVSNVLNTQVSGEKPGFQALSKGLIVVLCKELQAILLGIKLAPLASDEDESASEPHYSSSSSSLQTLLKWPKQ